MKKRFKRVVVRVTDQGVDVTPVMDVISIDTEWVCRIESQPRTWRDDVVECWHEVIVPAFLVAFPIALALMVLGVI